jgi:hypothetical protein
MSALKRKKLRGKGRAICITLKRSLKWPRRSWYARRRPERLGLGNHSGLRWLPSFRQQLVVSCRGCVTVRIATRERTSGRMPLPRDGLRSKPM